MNKEDFEAAMRGADLKERDEWSRNVEEKTERLDAARAQAAADESGITNFAKILGLLVIAAVFPAYVHLLYIVGRWSWNLL
jgi:hypothetical protein